MKRLQVFINNKWEFVFCRNPLKAIPITTDNRSKAIRGDQYSLEYFSNSYASLEFKIIK